MDYTKFSKTNNLVNDFYKLVETDENLAIGFLDNLMGIFLSKTINQYNDNLLICAIRKSDEDDEKVALKIIDTGLIDLGYTNLHNETALYWAIIHNKCNVAKKLLDSGLSNPLQVSSTQQAAIDFIMFDDDDEDFDDDPDKDIKIELLIKLMYNYIENDPTNSHFNTAIDNICKNRILLVEMAKLFKSKKNLNIDKIKFKEYFNFENPKVTCAAPVSTEAGELVTDLQVVNEPTIETTKSKGKQGKSNVLRATQKKPLVQTYALPEEESYLYNDSEAIGELIPKRNRLGGKNPINKSNTKSNQKTKTKTRTRKLR
jgi:hypothetical protein